VPRIIIVGQGMRKYQQNQIFSQGIENGSHDLLVGGYGRLFEVYTDDWGIVELSETAVGSGSSYALGSLYSTQDKEPLYRVHEALNASIQYSPTCAGPIDIMQV
jgi:hypothetical protein